MDSRKDTFFQVVYERRSVRDYTPEKVSEEDLRFILECARWAPSGENAQPWRFIIVRDEEGKKFLADVSKKASGRRFTGEFLSKHMQERFKGLQDEQKKLAAFKKLTSGDVSGFVSQGDLILMVIGRKDVWDLPYDTSAAIENILLAVASLGLGACWVIAPCIDVRDEEKVRTYFEIPEDYKVISIISIGKPARMPNPRPRLALKDIVFSEKFGKPYYSE
ncbi:MAG: nitroreductase family protein [Synergistetes bacterium]|nr:nitroreductase family protein [Synergistota bacterium]MDW8192413.1 nitroreductase family protein [Synergistota bacterium]